MTPSSQALLIVAVVVFGTIGFALNAVKRFKMEPQEFIVGGRSFGALLLWILLAGEIYTSFTFLGAAGWAYGKGAPAFYILAYGTIGYIIGYFYLPVVWRIGKERGLMTWPDFLTDRYGSKALGTAVAVLQFFLTVPYVTLQADGIADYSRLPGTVSSTRPWRSVFLSADGALRLYGGACAARRGRALSKTPWFLLRCCSQAFTCPSTSRIDRRDVRPGYCSAPALVYASARLGAIRRELVHLDDSANQHRLLHGTGQRAVHLRGTQRGHGTPQHDIHSDLRLGHRVRAAGRIHRTARRSGAQRDPQRINHSCCCCSIISRLGFWVSWWRPGVWPRFCPPRFCCWALRALPRATFWLHAVRARPGVGLRGTGAGALGSFTRPRLSISCCSITAASHSSRRA